MNLRVWSGRECFIRRCWFFAIFVLFLIPFFLNKKTFAANSSITVSIDNPTVSLDISPSKTNGSFAKSGNSTVSVSTNNYSGYTLKIESANGSVDLINTSDSTISIDSISSAVSESDFSADTTTAATNYNSKWGYLPSKLNSAANTDFQPSPGFGNNAHILDTTSVANVTANTYTLAIGARVGYDTVPGTYENTFVISAVVNDPQYSITFNPNTNDTVTNMPANIGTSTSTSGVITLPANVPVRTDYTFLGWDEDGTVIANPTYSPGDTITLDSTQSNALTLYAIWKNTYAVTFNLDGGTMSTSEITVTYHQPYGTLPTPTKTHYRFDGWYSDSGRTNLITSSSIVNTANDHVLYAKWTSLLLADYVAVGDYVNYPVNYSNVVIPVYSCSSSTSCTKSSTTYTPKSTYSGWRVLSIEGSGSNKYVRLIPAGIPMTYVLPTRQLNINASTAVTNLTTNFFSTPITSTATPVSNYNRFRECGFKQSNGSAVTTIAQLKTVFSNTYTQIKNGTPVVKSATKADIDDVWGSVTANATSLTSNNLLAIQSTTSGIYAPYYVATANATTYLWNVYTTGAIVYTDKVHGIRPVVSLTSAVETTGQTNNVWQIQ